MRTVLPKKFTTHKTATRGFHKKNNVGRGHGSPAAAHISDPCFGKPEWVRRLTFKEFEKVTRRKGDIVYGPTDEEKVGFAKYLRPKADASGEILTRRPNDDFNVLVSKDKIFCFMNEAYIAHGIFPGNCGVPSFKMNRFIKKGVTGRWSVACQRCAYASEQYFKLYNEVASTATGAKSADVNLGFSVGTIEIGSQRKARTLLACCNVNPISKTALQNSNNTIADKIVALNENDMRKRRKELLEIKSLRGLDPETSGVRIQADGLYNSTSICRRGRPGQAATQAVALACEDETPKHQVISVVIENKICYPGARLISRGVKPRCGEVGAHPTCTATIPDYCPIREDKLGIKIGRCLAEDKINVNYVTTDGDASLAKGIASMSKTPVKRQADIYHLGQTQFHTGLRAEFSSHMFPGNTKAERNEAKSVFCRDVAVRCEIIYQTLFRDDQGDENVIGDKLARIVDSVVECYSGCHNHCSLKTNICDGSDHSDACWWDKSKAFAEYGLQASQINMGVKDKVIVRGVLEMKLSKDSFDKIKFNSNTQKCESTNMRVNRVAPKCVTHLKNKPGKVHTAIHTSNNGNQESVTQKLDIVGVTIASGAADCLEKMDKDTEYAIEYNNRPSVRASRGLRKSVKGKDYYEYKRSGAVTDSDYHKDCLDLIDMSKIPEEDDHGGEEPDTQPRYTLRRADHSYRRQTNPLKQPKDDVTSRHPSSSG